MIAKFWKWSWIPAGLLVITLLITLFVLWRPPAEDEGDYIITQTYYMESAGVADDDERLANSYVNNSATNFFVQGDQLISQLSVEARTAEPYRRTFYDFYRKRTQSVEQVTLPAPRKLRVTADSTGFDGKELTDERFTAGDELSYIELCKVEDRYYYRLDEDSYLSAEHAVRICQRTAFEGTLAHPYTVDINAVQYIDFTSKEDYIYLYFTTDNEFISLFLEGLPKGSSWELFDRTYHKLAARYATVGDEEIFYRAPRASTFLLRINAAAAGRVEMKFHRDDNEWGRGMVNSEINRSYRGSFDYYGDEDYFVLDQAAAGELGALVMKLEGVDAQLQVMAYDRNKTLIGRYTRPKGVDEEIVLYGLENVYTLSVRTVDGSVRSNNYQVKFFYKDVDLLGLETFGFKLSKPVELGKNGENYYTAVCYGLQGKKIQDVQTASKCKVTMTLRTAAGATYSFGEGDDIPLHVGKNTVTITIENPSDTRVLTICITEVGSYELGYAFITTDGAPLRKQAQSSSGLVTTLSKGSKVLSTGVLQNGYLQVELTDGSGKSGWIERGQVFSDYEQTAMPSSYAPAIQRLQKAHPNWKFTFIRVGKTLEQAVSTEAGQNPIITTGDRWRTPSREQIRYYMDPRNFLNEQDIFMFEKQTYHEGSYSAAGIGAVWRERDEALYSADYYAECFLEAGKVAGLSPYFIAARASLESGNGTSTLAKGKSSGYEGYYNFYGINAVDSNPKQGAAYAKEHQWNTQRIAIVEGAVWIKDQYVTALQYTPYFIKYSFIPTRGWHQYMTDIAAPKEDAARCYAAHKAGGTLGSAIEFVIPVFD